MLISTPKAEFITSSESTWEVQWLFNLLKYNYGWNLPPLQINCDNQKAVPLIPTRIIKVCTMPIDICYHTSWGPYKWEIVIYSYIHQTKALPIYLSWHFLMLSIWSLQNQWVSGNRGKFNVTFKVFTFLLEI
jgi:hypothetical protein